MERVKRYSLIGILILVAGLWLKSCLHRQAAPPQGNVPVLQADDQLRLSVKDNELTVEDIDTHENYYVPEEGEAVVTVKKDGKAKVNLTNKGLTHQIGIGVIVADKLRLSVDYEFFYWNRFGVHAGLGFNNKPVIIGFGAISYQLDQLHLKNTSVLVGYSTGKNLVLGVRVSF